MSQQTSHPITKACVFVVNKLWLLFAALVILTAVVFTLLRLALPKIDYYKADIENWIEQQYLVEVDIGTIEAEWGANGPVLSLKQFEIKSDDGQLDLIQAEALEIDIDALGSILSGRLVTEDISLRKLEANVLLDRQLAVRLDALEDSEEDSQVTDIDATSQVVLNNLFSQKKLVVLDSLITVETLTGRQFRYHITQLDVDNFEEVHQFKGQLDDEHGGQIKLVAEIFGDPADDQSFTQLYLQGQNVDLTELPFYDKHPELKPASGKFDWRVWSDWRNGRWHSAVGDLQIKDIKWTDNEQRQTAELLSSNFENFSMDFSWKYNTTSSGELKFHNASLKEANQEPIEFSNIYMLFDQLSETDIQWEVLSHDFDVAPLVNYLALPLMSDPDEQDQLASAALSLNLKNLGIRVRRESGAWLKPNVYLEFDRFNFDELMGLPKVSNLQGQVSIFDGIGEAKLSATDTQIDLNDLFRNDLKFDSLEMSLTWFVDDNKQVDFRVNDALLTNKDLSIAAKTRFFFQDEQPTFALFAEVRDIDASQKSLYLPTGIMSDALVDYLDNSVKSGRLPVAKSIVRGPLSTFPYPQTDGIFSVLGFLEKSEFKFLPDWPAVEQLKAKLLFEGNGMNLQALGGKSGLVDVNFGRAVIKDFSLDNTPFELTIDATAKNNGGYQFLAKSPLSDIAESIELLDFKGKARTKMEMVFGLDDASNMSIKGQVIPQKKQASLTVGGFTFDKLTGTLHFDEQGIQKSKVNAEYFSEPVSAELYAGSGANDAELFIDAKGVVSEAAITDLIGEKWAELAIGKSEFNAKVQIAPPTDESAVLLKFNSKLSGIRLDLPGDLKKDKEIETPLEINIRLAESSDIAINWQEFKGRWWWSYQGNNYQHLGGEFNYRDSKKLIDKPNGQYLANVKLPQIEFEEWLPIVEKILEDEPPDSERTASSAESLLPDTLVDIEIEALINPIVKLENQNLQLVKVKNENWRLVSSGVAGTLHLDIKENQPWEANIAGLDLNFTEKFIEKFSDEASVNTNPDSDTAVDSELEDSDNTDSDKAIDSPPEKIALIENWPTVIVHCSQCKIHGFDLGEAKLNLVSGTKDVSLSGEIIKPKSHNLNFNLAWRQSNSDLEKTSSLENFSQIDFELSSENMGRLLRRLNYESGVKESRSRVVGTMSWNQLPWEFELLNASGKASFSLGKGYLSEVSDAKARLFSLFSLQTLSRRLQLDFSDVYKKGFFYNRITGEVSLENQTLTSHNIFVEGNAAKVTMVGNINLQDRSIEQHALVVPQLTSSLPVLVGWAVEPTTGILVFLLNKIFEPAIEVVTQIEYRIHGSLDEMAVDEVKKSKSKVKYDTPETEVSDEADAEEQDDSSDSEAKPTG